MPVVGVNRDDLFKALGKTYTDEEFEELCFEYGIELDDVTSEKEIRRKETQGSKPEDIEDASDDIIYKIDIPANRYDMLCLEGIARALKIFQRKAETPHYRLADMTGKQMQRMTVRPETAIIRPFVVCAILRGVTFDAARYNSFIDLQDKLHQNLCRQRTLVAIGTHDLSTIQGPFTYEALPPEDISFVPLKQTQEFNAKDLLNYYAANDKKLKRFVPIIQSSLVYPVIYDSKRTVLSLPPIINGAHSAISLNTKDVFIECTATDITKAKIVLNTVCAMFSEYCSTPFEIEPVEVIDAFGKSHIYPDLSSRSMDVTMEYINSCTGLSLGADKAAELLTKMQLQAQAGTNNDVTVRVPVTRSDVLHACDVMEDVAIAYGYNNLPRRVPTTATIGQELPLNQLCELLRSECAMAGFTEILTWALCSRHEVFGALRREDDDNAVSVGNPATAEFEVCRTTLLSGALKTLGANKDAALPVKLFEISDVILLSPEADVGAANHRRLVAVICNRSSAFEDIHGLLNRVMEVLHVPYIEDNTPAGLKRKEKYGGGYEWKAEESESFFSGMHATVYAKGQRVGEFGVIHPDVLASFDLTYPVTALELDLEPFCFDQFYNLIPTKALNTMDISEQ